MPGFFSLNMSLIKTYLVQWIDSSGKVIEQITLVGKIKKEVQKKIVNFKKEYLKYYNGKYNLRTVLTLIAKY